MGYTTEFSGQISIEPPLNQEEIEFLTKFSQSRRMKRGLGPYYVDGSDIFGKDTDVIEHNTPPDGQPGLWCQWIPSEDGKWITWDGGEKFYNAAEWMKYIIDHFLDYNPIAKSDLPFLQGHTCNGEIEARGEDRDDIWMIDVTNNIVAVLDGTISYSKDRII